MAIDPSVNTPVAPNIDSAAASQPAPTLPVAPGPSAPPTPGPNTVFPNQSQGTGAPADAAAQRHSTLGKVFGAVARGAAGGGTETDYAQSPNGPIPVQRRLRPGELAKSILANAFSLLASGGTGMIDAREGRPVELNPATTIGGMRQAAQNQRQQEAQQEFENQGTADTRLQQAHRDAREQQEAIQNASLFSQQTELNKQRLAAGDRKALDDQYDSNKKMWADYNSALSMPGSKVMTGQDGKELNFANLSDARDYAIKHPEVLHGSTNGNAMYGTTIVNNPYTGQWQIVDYPAERHDQIVTNFGQKRDKNGALMFDANGEPVPDGSVIDPKTHKPTVVTETITPEQAKAIQTQALQQRNIESEIDDRAAQARERDSQVQKNEELSTAMDLWDSGQFDKMTPRQRTLVAKLVYQDRVINNQRELKAQQDLEKAQGTGDPDQIKAAQERLDDAKDAYANSAAQYNQLLGITPGVELANKIVRTYGANVASNWNAIDAQIKSSGLTTQEQSVAKNRTWNSMSPQQQAAVKAGRVQQAPPAKSAPVPNGMVAVQIPGLPVGHIPQSALAQFLKDHPNAKQVQ